MIDFGLPGRCRGGNDDLAIHNPRGAPASSPLITDLVRRKIKGQDICGNIILQELLIQRPDDPVRHEHQRKGGRLEAFPFKNLLDLPDKLRAVENRRLLAILDFDNQGHFFCQGI